MRKLVLLPFALLAAMAVAQNPPPATSPGTGGPGAGPRARHGHMRARGVDDRVAALTRRFNLTEEQQQRLRPMLQDEAQQASSIRGDASLTREQKKQKLTELHGKTQADIQSLLTPEQRATAEANRGKKAMGWLDRKVNLTDEQKAKLEPMFTEQRQKVQAIRQNTSLTPQQRNQQIRDLRQETHKQMMAVLTPEQQQKLQSSKSHRRPARGPSQ